MAPLCFFDRGFCLCDSLFPAIALGSAFFEFTGKKYPKAKHRFTLSGSPFMAIAGLWREGKNGELPAFTMLTTEPSPDVEPYHNRQVVVLEPEDWAHWIYFTKPQAELLRSLPEGSLEADTVREGSDLSVVNVARGNCDTFPASTHSPL